MHMEPSGIFSRLGRYSLTNSCQTEWARRWNSSQHFLWNTKSDFQIKTNVFNKKKIPFINTEKTTIELHIIFIEFTTVLYCFMNNVIYILCERNVSSQIYNGALLYIEKSTIYLILCVDSRLCYICLFIFYTWKFRRKKNWNMLSI